MAIFEYDFMRRAFIVGILLAIIIPCIGVIVVLKRLSLIGDALSHSSLAGVAAGLVMGINPVLGAIILCIVSALAIEAIRKRIPAYSELSIAVILSASVGLSGVISGFIKSSANFNNFLFGSIVAISDFELGMVICTSLVVMLVFILLYKELFYIAFYEEGARLSGVPVKAVNFVFTVLTALTVSTAARTVGALVVSSFMVIPVACAMQISKSYKQTVIFSILFALLCSIVGLVLSFYVGLKPGGTMALAGVTILILILAGKRITGQSVH